jgi:ABC-type oligopeptide transport system ATPase subunit
MANAIVVYRGKPKVNSWARWMVGRTLKQNKNNLISVIGQTGSGKTYTAISICEIMSKMDGVPFGIDNVVFSLRELMDLINSGKLKRGSKIIFDEPQVSISAREFQSEANKVFNYLLSTFRHRNLTLFFCTPFETLLDKNSRRLFHARFETMSINRNNNTCRIKPRFIEYSDFKTDAYRKQLIVMLKDENGRGRSQKLFYWDVPKPSNKLIELYEQKKLEFTNNLNKNISERLKRFDESGKSLTAEHKDEVVKRKPLTPTQERVMNVLASIKESNKFERASEILKISMSAIHKNKTLAEKKGYVVEEFKENDD